MQFVRIVYKVLANNIFNKRELFLDNIGIKKWKNIYNNQELLLEIWHYLVNYIQNLNAIFANLKRTDITILKAKSQFYYADIKIMGYIYDSKEWHLDISKVLKIFDWPKYVNFTTT